MTPSDKSEREKTEDPLTAVIRIKGEAGTKQEIRRTLTLLNLHRPNHMTLVLLTPSYEGMLKKTRHLITWGPLHFDTFLKLLRERGMLTSGKKLNKKTISEVSNSNYQNFKELAEGIWKMRSLKEVENLKPVFRLSPPSGGYKNTKKSFRDGGSYGWRGEKINNLLKRMI